MANEAMVGAEGNRGASAVPWRWQQWRRCHPALKEEVGGKVSRIQKGEVWGGLPCLRGTATQKLLRRESWAEGSLLALRPLPRLLRAGSSGQSEGRRCL